MQERLRKAQIKTAENDRSNARISKAVSQYVNHHLTPNRNERDQIQIQRDHVVMLLGQHNCEDVGSYARQTATRPASDLDLLYHVETDIEKTSSRAILDELAGQIEEGLTRTKAPVTEVQAKTCSVGIDLTSRHGNSLSVEVVPAVPSGCNAGRTLYSVPKRPIETDNGQTGAWQISDPFYYSVRANHIEAKSTFFFRPAVRLVKSWLNGIKRQQNCPLRSFHLELIVGEICLLHSAATEVDLLSIAEETFKSLPDYIRAAPFFLDPADKTRWNDGYLEHIRKNDASQLEQTIAAAEDAASIMAELRLCRDVQDVNRRLDKLTHRQPSH